MTKTHLLAIFASLAIQASVHALTVPYVEDFASGNANWQNNANGLADFNATGGPDGSSYISAPFNFQGNEEDDTPVLLRARPSTPLGPASGGNFIGNWLEGGIKQVHAYVRHNAPEPLTYFARFADPMGFPGFIVGDEVTVSPNTWTAIDFAINPSNPNNFN